MKFLTLIIIALQIYNISGQKELIPKPGDGICGEVTHSDVIKGIRADLGEHPWLAALGYNYKQFTHNHLVENRTVFDCSGALITSKHVICAGHCINYVPGLNNPLEFVRLGARNVQLTNTSECINNVCADPSIDIDIDERYTNYVPNEPFANNIGLVKLVKSVQFSKWIKPICLPTDPDLQNNLKYIDESYVVSGWSRTPNNVNKSDIKLIREVVVSKHEICENAKTYRYDRNLSFCSHYNEIPCSGDGPVMEIDRRNPERPYWYIIGMYSYGPVECTYIEIYPHILAKIVPFINWIIETIER